jgi:hypothetical protein
VVVSSVLAAAGCALPGDPAPERGPSFDSGPVFSGSQPDFPGGPLPGVEPQGGHVQIGALGPAGAFGPGGDPGADPSGGSGDPGGASGGWDGKCDPSIHIQPDSSALIVTDPAALQGLRLETVLANLDWNPESRLPMMQRLFDTLNDEAGAVTDTPNHCDSPGNPAFTAASPASCPRPEGALAESEGFFTDGDPDQFVLVAAVNRFDLHTPNDSRCGEFRLIYAKASGKTDPEDRVFLIFEASVPMPVNAFGDDACYPLLQAWKAVADAPDPAARGVLLANLYLYGLPETGPILTRANLGDQFFGSGGYGGAVTQGRIRLSLHSGAAWEWHELGAHGDGSQGVEFAPLPVAGTPAMSLFNPAVWDASPSFRQDFLVNELPRLAVHDIADMGMFLPSNNLAGESLRGSGGDYSLHGAENPELLLALQTRIDGYGYGGDCPEGDPLTPDSVLRRVTAGTCAGCHSSAQFLGPERKVGCGVTWPEPLDGVHIDENGNLSPALKDVFLPRRARNLQKYLHGCVDPAAP